MPAAGTSYLAAAAPIDSHSSATWLAVDDMTITTPEANTYLAAFNIEANGSSSTAQGYRITVGGTPIATTVREHFGESSIGTRYRTPAIFAKISPNGSQDVVVEHAVSQGTPGTINSDHRTLTLVPMDEGNGDIVEAAATAADADSTTDVKQIDDMDITSPGASPWVTMFSCTQFWGNLTANVFDTFWIYEGGVAVTDSDRKSGQDESVDSSSDQIVSAGSLVTVTGTDNLAMYWDGNETDTRTCSERALVAIREFVEPVSDDIFVPVIPQRIVRHDGRYH
jgi:hypothetical protein